MAEVVVRSAGGLAQEVVARTHQFRADEPVEDGGADSGPSPYELLLAALGTCTAMTLRLYANRRGWLLDGVEVALSHQRKHAADCEGCESSDSRIDLIVKRITLRGALDVAQRQRLMEIAEHCPVHRTLLGTIKIDQFLVGSQFN